jgi:hypothetical protein
MVQLKTALIPLDGTYNPSYLWTKFAVSKISSESSNFNIKISNSIDLGFQSYATLLITKFVNLYSDLS